MKSDQDGDRDPDADEDGERSPVERAKARRDLCGSVWPKIEVSDLSQLGGNAEMRVEADRAQRDRHGHQYGAAAERLRDERQRDAGACAVDVEFRENRTHELARQIGRWQHRKRGRGDHCAQEQVRTEPAAEQ